MLMRAEYFFYYFYYSQYSKYYSKLSFVSCGFSIILWFSANIRYVLVQWRACFVCSIYRISFIKKLSTTSLCSEQRWIKIGSAAHNERFKNKMLQIYFECMKLPAIKLKVKTKNSLHSASGKRTITFYRNAEKFEEVSQ